MRQQPQVGQRPQCCREHTDSPQSSQQIGCHRHTCGHCRTKCSCRTGCCTGLLRSCSHVIAMGMHQQPQVGQQSQCCREHIDSPQSSQQPGCHRHTCGHCRTNCSCRTGCCTGRLHSCSHVIAMGMRQQPQLWQQPQCCREHTDSPQSSQQPGGHIHTCGHCRTNCSWRTGCCTGRLHSCSRVIAMGMRQQPQVGQQPQCCREHIDSPPH